MDRKLTFLGTGTSHGVPVIGCGCEVCRSDDHLDKRWRSSAIYRQGDVNILIDCGPDFRSQFLKYGSGRLDAVLLTHIHFDHTAGLDDLRTLSYENGLDVYADATVIDNLRQRSLYLFKHAYAGTPNLRFHTVMPYLPFTVGDVVVEPLTVLHGKMPVTAYKIGDFAYITDASSIPWETVMELKKCRTIVINALRWTEHFAHLNIPGALDVIKLTGTKKALLTHLSHEAGKHKELLERLPENVSPAFDGLVLDLNN